MTDAANTIEQRREPRYECLAFWDTLAENRPATRHHRARQEP